MDASVVWACIFIVVARIVDVSLGTLRMVSVVNGHAGRAWFLGFFEVLVWILAVSHVVQNLHTPVYAVSYALGYATGNYVGIRIEKFLAMGNQVVRVFTQQGGSLARALRDVGYRVTEFEGTGRDGRVFLLFLEVPRRESAQAASLAREIDSSCFVVIDDIRFSSAAMKQKAFDPIRAVVSRK